MKTIPISISPRVKTSGSETAGIFFEASAPRSPYLHLFEAENSSYLLIADGSRIYEIDEDVKNGLSRALGRHDAAAAVEEFLSTLELSNKTYIEDEIPVKPPIRALSLSVAQKCNLGCTYCYAQEGNFGGAAKEMPVEVAMRSVELLFSDVKPGESVNLSFLGGEPLINREVINAAAEKAVSIAESRNAKITFSITTNGTLLTPADGEFFEKYGFAVTISLDGIGEVHNRLRPLKSGKGSYERVIANVKPLLAIQRRMQVSARVTVTPRNLCLPETLDELIGMGFHSVGFSPMLSSPTGIDEMNSPELEVMLRQMIACGEQFERQIIEGRRYPFLNMINAMREIHRGTHRPYPCGAGANYLGVSADGNLYACHRFVDDERTEFGDIAAGVDDERRKKWLADRHVNRQEPCKSCWARYMCGGGCHHEVINRGRAACNYIRGWLHYCLQAYIRLSARRPDYFGVNNN
jgi:uncharacterized protein